MCVLALPTITLALPSSVCSLASPPTESGPLIRSCNHCRDAAHDIRELASGGRCVAHNRDDLDDRRWRKAVYVRHHASTLPQQVSAFLTVSFRSKSVSPWSVLAMGCFLETLSMLLIMVPVLISSTMGIDPVRFSSC